PVDMLPFAAANRFTEFGLPGGGNVVGARRDQGRCTDTPGKENTPGCGPRRRKRQCGDHVAGPERTVGQPARARAVTTVGRVTWLGRTLFPAVPARVGNGPRRKGAAAGVTAGAGPGLAFAH